MIPDLVEARGVLAARVDGVLASIVAGRAPAAVEREQVECKEEPGRRGQGGVLLPGAPTSTAAAEYLAREVCCLANTPGGGALVLGLEDATWQALGTDLDAEWLRHQIWRRADVAPAIEERHVLGQRLLVLFVAESAEPVTDPDNRLRWRVSDHCVPVDRAEWWFRRQERAGHDAMAAATERTVEDVGAEAISIARRHVVESGSDMQAAPSLAELLRRLGVLRPDERLTQAGTLVFCPAGRPLLTLARLDVPGGEVVGAYEPPGDLSLLEQLAQVESRLDAYNQVRVVARGLSEAQVRQLPRRAVREAVLNGLTHRDWMAREPTRVTWVDADASLEVVSPGGFNGGVTSDRLLTQRYARYPALSDLFRALGLVDKQGVGVDRMYREMVVLGHRPPLIGEQPGPQVRAYLVGGDPVVPVMTLISALRPEPRQRDYRIAVLAHELLQRPFLTLADAASVLQTDEPDASLALEAAEETTVEGVPLVRSYKDVWLLGGVAASLVERAAGRPEQLARRGILTYRRPQPDRARSLVLAWLARHDRITSGDYAALTGVAQPYATRVLTNLVGDALDRGDEVRGRNAHFVRRSGRSD
jgi:ATP-dependent DNA helicase RecG